MRASVSRASTLLPGAEKPKTHHPGQIGVVQLVDGLGVLVDEDVPVPVDHPVGILAVGGPDPGLLHHHHLGLDVEGGVALRAPDDLQGQWDDGGPEQDDEEGDHPGRAASPTSRSPLALRNPPAHPPSRHGHEQGGSHVGPEGHLAPLAVERDADGQRGQSGEHG